MKTSKAIIKNKLFSLLRRAVCAADRHLVEPTRYESCETACRMAEGFTLAETIMTLFIVGLVVTASIPLFTTRQNNGVAQEVTTPWDNCIKQDSDVRGLCGVFTDSDRNLLQDARGNYVSRVVIGNTNNNDFQDYDLSLYGVNANDTMFDIFQSDMARNFKVGDYRFIEDRTNFYIANGLNRPIDPVIRNGNRNVVIGNFRNNTVPNCTNENVIIGINNDIESGNCAMAAPTSNMVVIGNGNNVTSNSIAFGNGLTVSGGLKIGNNLNAAAANTLHIGNNEMAQQNSEFDIAGLIYGDHAAGLTFDKSVRLNGSVDTSTFTVTSDERLKNIKGSYTKGLKEVLQVEPVVFRYKGKSEKNIGVVAQDLQKIFPEAVVKMPDGYLGVNTDPVFFAMLNAMKEINQTTDAEIQRQEKLQNELKELQAELETLSACKRNDFWSKVRCFFYDAKMWMKSLIANTHDIIINEGGNSHEKV